MAATRHLIQVSPRTQGELFEFGTSLVNQMVEQNRFFIGWTVDRLDRSAADAFLLSFDQLVASFPRLIGLGAARADDVATRVALATNLYEECGEGNPARTHHAIYRAFLKSAIGDRQDSTECRVAKRWHDALAGYVFGASSAERAIAALAAGEFLAQPALERIHAVVGSLYPNANLEYFTTHLAQEKEHVRELTEVMSLRLTTETERSDVVAGFRAGIRIWSDYFDEMSERLSS